MKLFFALLCLLCAVPCLAAPPAVVVVLLSPATLHDWQTANAPTLHRLIETGALGMMNTRTAHQAGRQEQETAQSALLTLAAGARAAGFPSTHFLPASSPAPGTGVSAAALFERRTGTRAGPAKSLCLDWPAVLAANRNLGYDLRLGSLADTLAAHGVSVVSGGGPGADWLAAGGDGTVQHITTLRAAPDRFLVWDAGPNMASADKVLTEAAAQVTNSQGRLVILSPSAGDAAQRQLAPVLVWGPSVPAGRLRSPSTRRPCLVTDTDFAPSVAALFGISRPQFQSAPFGFAWSSEAAPGALDTCIRINAEAVRQSQGMRLLPYAAAGLGLWIACVTLLAARFAIPAAALFVPLAALSAALFAGSAVAFGLTFAALLAALALFSRFVGPVRLLIATSVFLTLVLCADAVTGNALMHRGLLGYSALEGARYYGLGNEAMGLLLGSALVAAGRLWRLNTSMRLALLGAMVGIVFLLGTAGAKAGGVLVSLAIFGAFLLAAGGHRWTAKTALLLVAVILAGMSVAALGDAFFSASAQSHIGEAVRRVVSGGQGEAWDIVRRKLAVEGRLAYHSAWAALLWLGLLSTARVLREPATDDCEKALRLAGGIGVAACLLLNDAGVVAASIFNVLLWTAAMTQKSPPALEGSKAEGPS